jgi:alkylation response protein AidB-like acyl-CoA dehydrogenase/putative sterol carrier protein
MQSPYLNQDHEFFRQSVRKFIETEVTPYVSEWEKEEKIPRSIWKRMGELGFLGINYEEKYGGQNADFFYSVVFLEELSRCTSGGFAAAVGVHQYIGISHIAAMGSDDLKQKYLNPAIAGEMVAALGVSEPVAGSDVANIKTRAVREGDHYVINGSKVFISNGYYCDFLTLAVKTDPGMGLNGISLLVVENKLPGFTGTKMKKMGWRSSDMGELAFDNVRVPVSNLLGEENMGFYYIMEGFQLERLVTAIGSVSSSEHAIELTLKYINEREAFGKKIKQYQTIRHELAQLATEVEAAKQLTHYASWLYSKGLSCVRECSMAKLLATELNKKVMDSCLQCFGGYGYMQDFPIERMFRDSRAGTIAGGTSAIMREIISRMMIDDVSYQSGYKKPAKTTSLNGSHNQTNENNDVEIKKPIIEKPEKAHEIIRSLAWRLISEKAKGISIVYHFDIEGESGGKFTVTIKDEKCMVEENLKGDPKCIVKAKANNFEDVELGRTNAQMAVMMGKIKVSNIGSMMKFMEMFKKLS